MPDRFDGTFPSPVTAGGTLTIMFHNQDLANTTVEVDVSNGDGKSTKVKIHLDGTGKGSTPFPVPPDDWDLVLLQQSTSDDHTVPVQPVDSLVLSLSEAASTSRAKRAAGKLFMAAKSAVTALQQARARGDAAGEHATVYLHNLARILAKR